MNLSTLATCIAPDEVRHERSYVLFRARNGSERAICAAMAADMMSDAVALTADGCIAHQVVGDGP